MSHDWFGRLAAGHAGRVKVFISSVRRGLEAERDALPGLIRALGHEPTRFEDFGAQAEPSRQACLAGVDGSDVYLLLLGPHYGHRFAETAQSPTHDEWVAATSRGMPRLVYRKRGVELEPEQEEFARTVGDYSSGVFHAEFSDTADLLTKVADSVRRLAQAPSPLTYEPLATAPPVSWRDEWVTPSQRGWSGTRERGYLEMHVIPLEAPPWSQREMRDMPERLVMGWRNGGELPVHAGADVSGSTAEAALVQLRLEDVRVGGVETTYGANLLGVRLAASGQFSLWSSLPGDQMGSIFDPDDIATTLARLLRLVGSANVLSGDRFAVAVGLGGSLMMMTVGRVTGHGRSSAGGFGLNDDPVRIEPDESVSAAAFERGADEVARSLAAALNEKVSGQ